MKKQFGFQALAFAILLVTSPNSARGQGIPKDTEIPNEFYFVSAQYCATQGATNAVITVGFKPGNRSWSGSVNFGTRDGTAKANQDYITVSGTLTFSGVSYRTFNVSVSPNQSLPKTVMLDLSPSPNDPSALITRSNAVLNVHFPLPPNLRISRGANETITLSWPDDGTELMLEKQVPPNANWNFVALPSKDSTGTFSVIDVRSGDSAFYRLRRAQ
jgi:hypothetical protein